ncbi:hypothetical protein [Streptomyces niveus]|uniref:hypothetical protein n=1 Tax=Streptomyces niveus TaxID=193462 RepID=UPI00339FA0A7
MSDTSIALISAGSALAASVITGGLTWLAGRSHLVLQLRDQKQTRSELHRREIYAACLELLTTHVTWSLTLTARQARGDVERIPEAQQKVADGSKMMLRRSAEIELVGPAALVVAFDAARAAALAVSDELDRLLEQGLIITDDYPPIAEETSAFNLALEAFVQAARDALGTRL